MRLISRSIIVFLLIVLLTPTVAANEIVNGRDDIEVEVDSFEIEIEILTGYYEDTDGDGLEDDVVTEYQLDIEGDDRLMHELRDYEVGVVYQLILPSGKIFEYSYDYKHFTKLIGNNDLKGEEYHTNIRVYFIDHALEAGFYEFHITLSIFGMTCDDSTTSIVFDPPGSEGGPPPPPHFAEFRR